MKPITRLIDDSSGWRPIAVAILLAVCSACASDTPVAPTPACTYSLSPASFSFEAPGGPGSVTVTAASECSWIARPEAGWLSVTGGETGRGQGTVTFTAAANPDTAARSGGLTVAGQLVPVSQAGAAVQCTYVTSPDRASFPKDGGNGTVAVTAPGSCPWSSTSHAAWVTVTAGSQGTGDGSVSYVVARNSDTAPRSTTVAVADRTVEISQSGDTGDCQYSVAPVEFNPCMSSPAEFVTSVTTQPSCSWTAAPNAPWITITRGQSGSGSGVISFRVSDNWDAPRDALVLVRWPTPTQGQNLRVRQAGCYYAVSTSALNVGSSGGPGTFEVYQQSDPNTCGGPTQNACLWTAQSDVSWITITSVMPQFGDNRVSFTAAPNTGTAARSGRITVRDKAVVVMQAGR